MDKYNAMSVDEMLCEVIPDIVRDLYAGKATSVAQLAAKKDDAVCRADYEMAASLQSQIDSNTVPRAGRIKNSLRDLVLLQSASLWGLKVEGDMLAECKTLEDLGVPKFLIDIAIRQVKIHLPSQPSSMAL